MLSSLAAILLTLSQKRCRTGTLHTGGPKKNWHTYVRLLTSSNVDRFSNFFRCQNREKICNSSIAKDPTTPQVPHINDSVCKVIFNGGIHRATLFNEFEVMSSSSTIGIDTM